jgi:hypothetical protein
MDKKRTIMMIGILVVLVGLVYGQYEDGILLNVQEVDLDQMRRLRFEGSESVLLVIEQFTDNAYRYAFISSNYSIDRNMTEYLRLNESKMMIVVAVYPSMNNLLYTQVFYNNRYFFIVIVKQESDFVKMSGIQITRMNYEKRNQNRRNNLKEFLRANNIIPMGIEYR